MIEILLENVNQAQIYALDDLVILICGNVSAFVQDPPLLIHLALVLTVFHVIF